MISLRTFLTKLIVHRTTTYSLTIYPSLILYDRLLPVFIHNCSASERDRHDTAQYTMDPSSGSCVGGLLVMMTRFFTQITFLLKVENEEITKMVHWIFSAVVRLLALMSLTAESISFGRYFEYRDCFQVYIGSCIIRFIILGKTMD